MPWPACARTIPRAQRRLPGRVCVTWQPPKPSTPNKQSSTVRNTTKKNVCKITAPVTRRALQHRMRASAKCKPLAHILRTARRLQSVRLRSAQHPHTAYTKHASAIIQHISGEITKLTSSCKGRACENTHKAHAARKRKCTRLQHGSRANETRQAPPGSKGKQAPLPT